ncbi:MAG: hypothetical protein U0271_12670 [Polyangiaceae bacterium]
MAAAVGCAGSKNSDDDDIAIPLTSSTVTARDSSTNTTSTSGATDELNDDQKEQMKIALRRGGDKAKECNKVTGASVSGEGEVQVVFDGEVGKVVDAIVGPPFAGTAIEGCIKRSFIDEYALRFNGKLTVPYNVKIEAPAGPPPKDPKKDPKKK